MTRIQLAAVFTLCGMAASGCSSAAPAAPIPPAFTAPTGPPPFNIAGNWGGSFQTSNLGTRTITMTIVQSLSCVDGAWKDAAGQWSGAISGLATDVSFNGLISFERTADGGGACTASGTVAGPIGADGIHWKVGSFTASASCNGDLPQATVITLQPAS
jgi:hypothetical protein